MTTRSTVAETDIGKIAVTPRANNLASYDIIDLITKEGRAWLSLKTDNTADVSDSGSWMKITENSYDTAVRLGLFTGTETEWIASLSAASEEAARLAREQIELCKEATGKASQATEKADQAADRLNELSDNRDKIIDGYWWRYNEATKAYENTGEEAKGNVMYALFGIDPETGLLSMETELEYTGPDFGINGKGQLILTM